jgi:hypothetical protein
MKTMKRKVIAFGCSLMLLVGVAIPSGGAIASEATYSDHMQKVLEENSTYEGFMQSDDRLTFDEIASLPGAVVGNEYDELKALKTQSVNELYALGMDTETVNRIKTQSVKEMILEHAATFSDAILQKKGLDEDAIAAIRNGEYGLVSEAETRAVSGQIAVGIASITRSGTVAKYNIFWHWDTKPIQNWTDTLVGSIDGGYKTTVDCAVRVDYAPMNSMKADPNMEQRPKPTRDDNAAIIKIRMANASATGWAVSGKFFVTNTGSYLGALGPHAEYFHAWLPDVDLSIDAGIISIPIGNVGTKHIADATIPAA